MILTKIGSGTAHGIPAGGSAGQVLAKSSGTDYDAAWVPAGSGGAVSAVFGRTGAVVATTGDYTVSQVTGAAPDSAVVHLAGAETVAGAKTFSAAVVASAGLAVGNANLLSGFVSQVTATSAGKALVLAGASAATRDDTNGVAWVLSYNATNNRQVTLFDSAQYGDGASYGFRFILGRQIPFIDAIRSDLGPLGNVGICQGGSLLGVGFSASDPQSAIQAQLHVRGQGGAGVAAIVQGGASQTADLIQACDPSGAVLAKVDAAGVLSAAGYATAASQNKETGTLAAGSPVATHGSGTGIVGASAADGTKPAVGLLLAGVAAGFAGAFASAGPVTLADWTAVVGSATLAARAAYYLSATAGQLTATPPTTPGQVSQRVGVAVSTTTLELQLSRPILL